MLHVEELHTAAVDHDLRMLLDMGVLHLDKVLTLLGIGKAFVCPYIVKSAGEFDLSDQILGVPVAGKAVHHSAVR